MWKTQPFVLVLFGCILSSCAFSCWGSEMRNGEEWRKAGKYVENVREWTRVRDERMLTTRRKKKSRQRSFSPSHSRLYCGAFIACCCCFCLQYQRVSFFPHVVIHLYLLLSTVQLSALSRLRIMPMPQNLHMQLSSKRIVSVCLWGIIFIEKVFFHSQPLSYLSTSFLCHSEERILSGFLCSCRHHSLSCMQN